MSGFRRTTNDYGRVEKWRDRLTEVRNQIERLEEKPKEFKFEPYDNPGSEYPMLRTRFSCVEGYCNIRSRRK
jgi:hypothetical protein